MKDYRNYTIEEFATDAAFRQWVLDPDDELNEFWETWLVRNPDKSIILTQATELLIGVQEKFRDNLSDEQLQNEIDKLVQLAEDSKKRRRFSLFRGPFTKVAAAVLIVSGIGMAYYLNDAKKLTSETVLADQSFVVKKNNEQKEITILLSDGSVATLKTGSVLKFPRKFSGDVRQVFLTGEAFFDVTKNPTKPFLVIANETVTKVLGTSFRVKAVEGDNKVMVVVKTGRVSVYPRKEYETLTDKKDNRAIPGVVLQPNQQVVFNRTDNRLDKSLVENPDMLSESLMNQELIFDDQPIPSVLRTLEKMYGIVIVFDEESLAHCPISTIFKEENLKQRLNAICQAIGATYEVVDGQIILNSKGCNH